MLQSSESETEILLGNKQLLGIFFAVVLLLGVAFAGGYKIGQSSAKKALVSAPPPAAAEEPAASSSAAASPASAPSGGETHAFPAGGSSSEPQAESSKTASAPAASDTGAYHPPSGEDDAPPLGSSSKHVKVSKPAVAAPVADTTSGADFSPISGQTFLQVAAVGRDEAQAIADVLHKKGFRAHAVPKPGSPKTYRVLIGPIRDSGDLASTRDSLRRTGFREIFVQRY